MKYFLFLVILFFNWSIPTETKALILSRYTSPILVQPKDEDPLFIEEQVLEFRLTVDYQALLQDRGEERGYHPAVLTYKDSTGAAVNMNLKVMVRGNRRRDPNVCAFPPLMLNFVRKTSKQTIFRKVNKVKLVTHCINEDFVVREYLVYKLYNLLTNHSFRVRLCRVEYKDLHDKRKTELKYAFMIEDDDDMAKRNNGEVVPKKLVIPMHRTEERAMARVAFFQYLIGNTDWSVPYRHNMVLVSENPMKPPVPVPFDFDYAGIVGTPYAVPPPELGITSVRQRLFRGYTYSENTFRESVNTFNAHRTAIYAVYRQCDLLERGYLKRTLKYFDSFYKTINHKKDFQNKIVRVAQKNQQNYVVVSGLEKQLK